MWGPRAQMDRKLYKRHMQEILFNYPNLDVRAAGVFDLIVDPLLDERMSCSSEVGSITGVKLGGSVHDIPMWEKWPIDRCGALFLETGEIILCSNVVICTGTFLSGEIHIGDHLPFICTISEV